MLFRTSNISNIYGPVSFLLYESYRMLFFKIDVDIQLILEFKNSFRKNCPFFPKNHKAGCFFGQAVLQI